MTKQYYLIIAGPKAAAFTSKPVATAEEAQEDVYGFQHEGFKCIPIGEEKPKQYDALDYIAANGRKLLKKNKGLK